MDYVQLVGHEIKDAELDYYCNYPEVTKGHRNLFIDEEEQSYSDSSSSSGLPSYTTAVSDPCSHNVKCSDKESPSLINFYELPLSSGEELSGRSELEPFDDEEKQSEEEFCPIKPKCSQRVLNQIDPAGWVKYASDPDPWNKKFYTHKAEKQFPRSSVLTHEDISKCTSNISQLPDSKAFVFSRLHINKMDLVDISVLSNYRYFMYIDMSWNLVSDLAGLNNSDYLMYLNVSHNKLNKVLDFKPPWFLTHVNLSCNEIKEIGENLSEFWSLNYLDLSHNLIEKIEGLHNLRYLKHLNLSHNFIKQLENLHCINLQELNLTFNKITSYVVEDGCFQNLKELRELNLANNFLTTLHPFGDLILLKKLDVSNNKITEFYDLDCIEGFMNLSELSMTGNNVCSCPGYREFIIIKLSTLRTLDSVPVNSCEKVAAKMLWKSDMFSRTFHLRSKIEFWNQLAAEAIDSATVPFGDPPIPLVVLVGTFANKKEEVAKMLEIKFPDQVHRCRKVTTMPDLKNHDESNLDPVSIDDFNHMIKSGKLLFYYKEIGCLFGVAVDELLTCVTESKIGIIETTFEGALVLKTLQCRPFLVLCIMEDTNSYTEKLNTFFTESDLWNMRVYHPVTLGKMSVAYESSEATRRHTHTNFSDDFIKTTLHPTLEFMSYQSFPISDQNDTVEFQKAGMKWSDFTQGAVTQEQSARSVSEDDDGFEWTWTYEPSVVSEIVPSESYLTMVRGRDMFVASTLEQQNICLDVHNSNPTLFTAVVYIDDVNSAVKQVGKICCDVFNQRGSLRTKGEHLLTKPVCKKFVDDRVMSLMKELLNVPSEIS